MNTTNDFLKLSQLNSNTGAYYNLSSMKSLIQYLCNNSKYTSDEILSILKLEDKYFDGLEV